MGPLRMVRVEGSRGIWTDLGIMAGHGVWIVVWGHHGIPKPIPPLRMEDFDTVQDFWSCFNALPSPLALASKHCLHIMKRGVCGCACECTRSCVSVCAPPVCVCVVGLCRLHASSCLVSSRLLSVLSPRSFLLPPSTTMYDPGTQLQGGAAQGP